MEWVPTLGSSGDAAGAVFYKYLSSGNFKLSCCFARTGGSLNELRQETDLTLLNDYAVGVRKYFYVSYLC